MTILAAAKDLMLFFPLRMVTDFVGVVSQRQQTPALLNSCAVKPLPPLNPVGIAEPRRILSKFIGSYWQPLPQI